MRRLAFLTLGSAIVFAMGTSPAFADNGPHVSHSMGVSSTVASVAGGANCASCHRAHTAQGAYNLVNDQESLCYTCHGTGASGSTLDVQDGVDSLGAALRGGGFSKAAIDSGNPQAKYYLSGTSTRLEQGVIGTLGFPVATTSRHGVGVANTTAFGGGLSGTGVAFNPLECGSCHDPHGNGNYRILKPVPDGVTNATFKVTNVSVTGTTATVTVDLTQTKVGTGAAFTATSTFLNNGSTVTIAGVGAPFDGPQTLTGAPTLSTLTFTTTAAAGTTVSPAAGTVINSGTKIPDATTKTYTTTNYWAASDDAVPTGTYQGTTSVSGFIGNIAQWCTQCHTRYLAGSGSYKTDSGDPMYTYRHRSQAVKTNVSNGTTYINQVNAANCIQCHVAHGSNATMTGASAMAGVGLTTQAGAPPGQVGGGTALLRINNRGTCEMCHNK